MSPGTEGKSLISELEMVSISVSVSGPVLQLRQLNMKVGGEGGAELQVDWLPVTTDTSICKCFPESERERVCA